MTYKTTSEFKKEFPYLKLSHYVIVKYLLNWMMSGNSLKTINFNGFAFFWVSIKKLSDDLDLSKTIVRRSLYRLENKDKNINYGENEPILFSKIITEKEQQNKLFLRFNYKAIQNMFENGDEIIAAISKKTEVKMPALFNLEFDKKRYSEKSKEIVENILRKNSDLFKTKIGKTKTFENCCGVVQDIYTGNFTNPRLYSLSGIENIKWFDTDDWKKRIDDVKGDYGKIEKLLDESIKNYRQMFDENKMPITKKYLPNDLSKWFYDKNNINGYLSYFVFSLNEPKYKSEQFNEISNDKTYGKLPSKVQSVGNKIMTKYTINKDSLLWKNLKGMYGWCVKVYSDDELGKNMGYWADSASDIMVKFLKWCEDNPSVNVNEYLFNVKESFERNKPFKWFITNAINEHKLNKNILQCYA